MDNLGNSIPNKACAQFNHIFIVDIFVVALCLFVYGQRIAKCMHAELVECMHCSAIGRGIDINYLPRILLLQN